MASVVATCQSSGRKVRLFGDSHKPEQLTCGENEGLLIVFGYPKCPNPDRLRFMYHADVAAYRGEPDVVGMSEKLSESHISPRDSASVTSSPPSPHSTVSAASAFAEDR